MREVSLHRGSYWHNVRRYKFIPRLIPGELFAWACPYCLPSLSECSSLYASAWHALLKAGLPWAVLISSRAYMSGVNGSALSAQTRFVGAQLCSVQMTAIRLPPSSCKQAGEERLCCCGGSAPGDPAGELWRDRVPSYPALTPRYPPRVRACLFWRHYPTSYSGEGSRHRLPSFPAVERTYFHFSSVTWSLAWNKK